MIMTRHSTSGGALLLNLSMEQGTINIGYIREDKYMVVFVIFINLGVMLLLGDTLVYLHICSIICKVNQRSMI